MGFGNFYGPVGRREFAMGMGSFAWAHVVRNRGALGRLEIGAFYVCLAVWIRGLGGLG